VAPSRGDMLVTAAMNAQCIAASYTVLVGDVRAEW
jgi:hypothetical protein